MSNKNAIIVIPARYGSTRFLGKMLAEIAGMTMFERVCRVANNAAQRVKANNPDIDISIIAATEDQRIVDYCDQNAYCAEANIKAMMTPESCASGTDRVLAVMEMLDNPPENVINLQGDAPLTPPDFIESLLDKLINDKSVKIVTPIEQLSWQALDKLRQDKLTTPFSGTCAIKGQDDNAVWFSKNIIPAIRKEDERRNELDKSPVFRHIGLYGYKLATLKEVKKWPISYYEKLEGLEQLRWLENGLPVRLVVVDYADRPATSGIDSLEDVQRAEALIAEYGDIYL